MIQAYLNFNAQAKEAATYYANAFGADAPYIMTAADMPPSPEEEAPFSMPPDFVVYAHVETFAGSLMMSDALPDQPVTPNEALWITVSDTDETKLRKAFERLAADGTVIMPMETTFFSPLYGQVKDKYGFAWMFMIPGDA